MSVRSNNTTRPGRCRRTSTWRRACGCAAPPGQKVRKFAGRGSRFFSVRLTQVISSRFFSPRVWLKASCVESVQIKTPRQTRLSSTPQQLLSSQLRSSSPSQDVYPLPGQEKKKTLNAHCFVPPAAANRRAD